MFLFKNSFNLISKFGQINQTLSRHISITQAFYFKEVRIRQENDKTTIVEAVKVASPRTDKLVNPPSSSNSKACPLCRLNLRRLSYTDVLILNQFVESNGNVMPRQVTGLCNRQYNKVVKLVKQAQRCNLMPRSTDYVVYGPWESFNTYFEPKQRFRDRPMTKLKPEYWR